MLFIGAGAVEPPVIGDVHHQLGFLPHEAAHPASHYVLKANQRNDSYRGGAPRAHGHGHGAGGGARRVVHPHCRSGGGFKGLFQEREGFPHGDVFAEGDQHGLGVRPGRGIVPFKDGEAVVGPRHAAFIGQVNVIRARQQDEIAYPVPEGLDIVLLHAQEVDVVLVRKAFPRGIAVKRGNGEGTLRPDYPGRHVQGGFRPVFGGLFQGAVLEVQHPLLRRVQQSPVNGAPVGRVPFLLLAQVKLHGHDGNGEFAVPRGCGGLRGVARRPEHAGDEHD